MKWRPPTAGQVAAVWQGFLHQVDAKRDAIEVAEVEADTAPIPVDDEDEDAEEPVTSLLVGADPELCCMVLYPDGSGGVLFDLPPGKPPPAQCHLQWWNVGHALEVLRFTPPATSRTTAATVTSAGDVAVQQLAALYARRLALNRTKKALKDERKALFCEHMREGGTSPDCDICTRRADHSSAVRKVAATLSSIDRKANALAKAAGLEPQEDPHG